MDLELANKENILLSVTQISIPWGEGKLVFNLETVLSRPVSLSCSSSRLCLSVDRWFLMHDFCPHAPTLTSPPKASAVHFFDQLSKPTSSRWLLYLHPRPQYRGWRYFQCLLRGHLCHPALLLVTLFFFFACLGKFPLSLSLHCEDFPADLEKDFLSGRWQTFSPDLVPLRFAPEFQ